MTGTQKIRRRRYVIDRAFQFFYLRLILGISLLFCVILLGFYLWFDRILSGGADPGEILRHTGLLMQANAIFMLVIGAGIGLYTVLHTHRIAGPAYRLRRCVTAMLAGDLSEPVRVRRKDYLQDLAGVIERLRLRMLEEEERRRHAMDAIGRAHEGAEGETRRLLDEILRSLLPDRSESPSQGD